jgi:hypothetical protein
MTAQPALDLQAAPSELAWDFPEISPGTLRHPATVPWDEQRAELAAELERRRRLYPRSVERQTMTPETMHHEIAVFAAMLHDYDRAPDRPRPFELDWRTRIIALRRELTLRRTAYPKWVASPSNPLTEADARQRLERLDAVYHRYWRWLLCFDPPLETLALEGEAYQAERQRQRQRTRALKFQRRMVDRVGPFPWGTIANRPAAA